MEMIFSIYLRNVLNMYLVDLWRINLFVGKICISYMVKVRIYVGVECGELVEWFEVWVLVGL